MNQRSKKSATKPQHLDPTLVKEALDPDVAALLRTARAAAFVDTAPAKCFEHFRARAEAIPAEGVVPFRGVPLVMHGNVQRAVAVAEPGFARAAGMLRAPRFQDVYELPSLVLGLQFAAGRVPGAALSQGEIASLLEEQTPWRRLTLAYLDVVSDPLLGIVPADRVAKVHEGRGPLDRATDCVDIAGIFTEFEGALAGRHPFTKAQLARLAEVGGRLMQQMRPGNAPREERVRGPEATLRDQFAALVTERFDHLLLLATTGLGRARAEAEMPALHTTARAAKGAPAEAKKDDTKPAEPKRPSVAPPARPSAPPPN